MPNMSATESMILFKNTLRINTISTTICFQPINIQGSLYNFTKSSAHQELLKN